MNSRKDELHLSIFCVQRQLGPEDAQKSVVIQERRLHVGVYNGWGFLDKPQVVLLELVTDGSTKRSRPVKDR